MAKILHCVDRSIICTLVFVLIYMSRKSLPSISGLNIVYPWYFCRMFNGKPRRFKSAWLEKHHWMRYSIVKDVVYCIYAKSVEIGTKHDVAATVPRVVARQRHRLIIHPNIGSGTFTFRLSTIWSPSWWTDWLLMKIDSVPSIWFLQNFLVQYCWDNCTHSWNFWRRYSCIR